MSRFIEFTRDPSHKDSAFARGNPLHDGNLPTRFRSVLGVRIDGAAVEFQDETLVDRLHKTLVEGKALLDRKAIFDCIIFAALMQGLPLGQPGENGSFTLQEETQEVNVQEDDTSITTPLNLGGIRGGSEQFLYAHTVVPAHTSEGAHYLHKMGSQGNVCLSGLAEVKNMYHAAVAHPMIKFALL